MTETQKTIIAVYAMIMAGSVLTLVPYGIVPFSGLACLFVGAVAAYVYRWRNRDQNLMDSHMRYIIRTFWWSSLILLIGIAAFAAIIVSNGDLSMIDQMTKRAEAGIIPTEDDIQAMQYAFLQGNAKLIGLAALLSLPAYPFFLLYRVLRGVRSVVQKETV